MVYVLVGVACLVIANAQNTLIWHVWPALLLLLLSIAIFSCS